MTRCFTIWTMLKDTFVQVERAVVRTTRLISHMHRPTDERWVEWHIRACLEARQTVVSTWGCRPAALVAARAVCALQQGKARLACLNLGGVLRWRSRADVATLRAIADGYLCLWRRQGPA